MIDPIMRVFATEILCVGNELLSGITINMNAYWLSKKITEVGGSVKRITAIRDDVDEISLAVRESIARKPDWLIISGGLGPTYDDKTLQGVASGLRLELELDNMALDMLKKSYSRQSINYELNEIRLKMAKIPVGSNPIQNPVGSAPSVLIETNETKIVCLPGVPNEMEAIFLESILPQMKKIVGDFHIVESSYETVGVSEAMLAPTLSEIVESNPHDSIYLKTHPLGQASDNNNPPQTRVQIISKGNDKDEVQRRFSNISKILIEEISRLKGKIVEVRKLP
ncbi:MAG TPA: molybdopterin-binding protein [Candidatus Bathyarchaeia archaeon]|nr:molybdopterin-binding protein [Candidatus Bathyarchaeia archaeon]